MEAAREVIAAHRAYLEGAHELDWLAGELRPLRDRIEPLLHEGARSRHPKTASFCAGLLDEYEALWTFGEVPDVEPTNNAAERALRHAVIMRKVQLGTQSDRGSRWIERVCSVRETCRLQERSRTRLPGRGGGRCPRPAPRSLAGPSVRRAGITLRLATARERVTSMPPTVKPVKS